MAGANKISFNLYEVLILMMEYAFFHCCDMLYFLSYFQIQLIYVPYSHAFFQYKSLSIDWTNIHDSWACPFRRIKNRVAYMHHQCLQVMTHTETSAKGNPKCNKDWIDWCSARICRLTVRWPVLLSSQDDEILGLNPWFIAQSNEARRAVQWVVAGLARQ